MLPQKPAEEIKHSYTKDYGVGLHTTTRRANNLAGFFSAIYCDPQFGRIESNPEQQECDKKSP